MPRANPRAVCVDALLRWEGGSEFADAILHRVFTEEPLTMLDRALFTEIFYGIIRFKRLLDFISGQLREGELDPRTRQVLRLGLYQLLRTRIPQHAAVNETVEVAGRARKLVNALLRRFLREENDLRLRLDAAPLDVRHSHPELLVNRWRNRFGEENTERLCSLNNEPAEVFVRANELKISRGELFRAAGGELLDEHPVMLRVRHMPLPWIVNGLCYVQDPSTLLACELLDPQPGERVLDACAAPGGKTSYLAQLMRNRGVIVACDSSKKRLPRLKENLERLGVEIAQIAQVDWTRPPFTLPSPGPFDRILVDAPCSNTGVIRRRVDVRWRLTPEDFPRMSQRQFALVQATSQFLKPGGVLVYSTCSIEPEENEQIVELIRRELPQIKFIESRQTLPFRDPTDGAYAAKFERL